MSDPLFKRCREIFRGRWDLGDFARQDTAGLVARSACFPETRVSAAAVTGSASIGAVRAFSATYHDNFSGDLSRWQAVSPSLTTSAGQATVALAPYDAASMEWRSVYSSDFAVEATFSFSSTGALCQLGARATSPFWSVSASVDSYDGTLVVSDGVAGALGSTPLTVAVGQPFTLRFTGQGSTLRAYVDGVLLVTAETTFLDPGFTVIWVENRDPDNSTTVTVDDFAVTNSTSGLAPAVAGTGSISTVQAHGAATKSAPAVTGTGSIGSVQTHGAATASRFYGGNTADTDTYLVGGANRVYVQKAVIARAGTPLSVTFRQNNNAVPSAKTRAVIYSDSGATPSTLIAVGGEVVGTVKGYNTLPISAPSLAPGTYWVGYHTDSQIDIRITTGAPDQWGCFRADDLYTDGTATTWVNAGTSSWTHYGIFATVAENSAVTGTGSLGGVAFPASAPAITGTSSIGTVQAHGAAIKGAPAITGTGALGAIVARGAAVVGGTITIGQSTGASFTNIQANNIYASLFAPAVRTTVTKIRFTAYSASATAHVRGVIYTNSGGNLVGTTTEISSVSVGINDLVFATPLDLVAGTSYWIGFHSDAAGWAVSAAVVAGGTYFYTTAAYANGSPALLPGQVGGAGGYNLCVTAVGTAVPIHVTGTGTLGAVKARGAAVAKTGTPQPLDANTYALFRFDAAADQLWDEGHAYRFGQHVVGGAPTVTTGLFGTAVRISADSYANTGSPWPAEPLLEGEVTLEAWVRATAYSSYIAIQIRGGSAMGLYLYPGALRVIADTASGEYQVWPSQDWPIGKWFHVAARRRLTGGNWFLDVFLHGQLIDSAQIGTPVASNPQALLQIDADDADVDFDEVRISKVARTDAEIAAAASRALQVVTLLPPWFVARGAANTGAPAVTGTGSIGSVQAHGAAVAGPVLVGFPGPSGSFTFSGTQVWLDWDVVPVQTTVTALRVCVAGASAGAKMRGVIFDGNGSTRTLRATTQEITGLVDGWNTLTFNPPVALAPGTYAFGTHQDTSVQLLLGNGTHFVQHGAADAYTDGTDSTWTDGGGFGASRLLVTLLGTRDLFVTGTASIGAVQAHGAAVASAYPVTALSSQLETEATYSPFTDDFESARDLIERNTTSYVWGNWDIFPWSADGSSPFSFANGRVQIRNTDFMPQHLWWADFAYEMVIRGSAATGWIDLLARNGVWVGFDFVNSRFRIWVNSAETFFPYPLAPNQDYRIRVTGEGTTLRVYIDGQLVHTQESEESWVRTGYVGLFQAWDTDGPFTAEFDDFSACDSAWGLGVYAQPVGGTSAIGTVQARGAAAVGASAVTGTATLATPNVFVGASAVTGTATLGGAHALGAAIKGAGALTSTGFIGTTQGRGGATKGAPAVSGTSALGPALAVGGLASGAPAVTGTGSVGETCFRYGVTTGTLIGTAEVVTFDPPIVVPYVESISLTTNSVVLGSDTETEAVPVVTSAPAVSGTASIGTVKGRGAAVKGASAVSATNSVGSVQAHGPANTQAPATSATSALGSVHAVGGGSSLAFPATGTGSLGTILAHGAAVARTDARRAKRIAAGTNHSVTLTQAGTFVGWGQNSVGCTQPPAGVTDPLTEISAGIGFNIAIKQDKTIVAWGANLDGQSTVPGGLTNIKQVAAGGYHGLALDESGTMYAWGRANYLQTTIPGGLTNNVKYIAAGQYFSVAVKLDGTVVAWGQNNSGQTTIPAALTNPATANVIAVTTGSQHCVALKSDGTVVAWGYNNYGQSTVPQGLSDVQAIAAGGFYTAALKNDGSIVMWGYNGDGRCNVPQAAVGVTAIASGDTHMLALIPGDEVIAWGYGALGQVTPPCFTEILRYTIVGTARGRGAAVRGAAAIVSTGSVGAVQALTQIAVSAVSGTGSVGSTQARGAAVHGAGALTGTGTLGGAQAQGATSLGAGAVTGLGTIGAVAGHGAAVHGVGAVAGAASLGAVNVWTTAAGHPITGTASIGAVQGHGAAVHGGPAVSGSNSVGAVHAFGAAAKGAPAVSGAASVGATKGRGAAAHGASAVTAANSLGTAPAHGSAVHGAPAIGGVGALGTAPAHGAAVHGASAVSGTSTLGPISRFGSAVHGAPAVSGTGALGATKATGNVLYGANAVTGTSSLGTVIGRGAAVHGALAVSASGFTGTVRAWATAAGHAVSGAATIGGTDEHGAAVAHTGAVTAGWQFGTVTAHGAGFYAAVPLTRTGALGAVQAHGAATRGAPAVSGVFSVGAVKARGAAAHGAVAVSGTATVGPATEQVKAAGPAVAGVGSLGAAVAHGAAAKGAPAITGTSSLGAIQAHGAAAKGAAAQTGTSAVGAVRGYGAGVAHANAATGTGSIGTVRGTGAVLGGANAVAGTNEVGPVRAHGGAIRGAPAVSGTSTLGGTTPHGAASRGAPAVTGTGSLGATRATSSAAAHAVSAAGALGAVKARGAAAHGAVAVTGVSALGTTNAKTTAAGHPVIGTAAVGAVLAHGAAVHGAVAVSGTGTLGGVAAQGALTLGAAAVTGTGTLGAVKARGAAQHGAPAVSGLGLMGGVRARALAAGHPVTGVATLGVAVARGAAVALASAVTGTGSLGDTHLQLGAKTSAPAVTSTSTLGATKARGGAVAPATAVQGVVTIRQVVAYSHHADAVVGVGNVGVVKGHGAAIKGAGAVTGTGTLGATKGRATVVVGATPRTGLSYVWAVDAHGAAVHGAAAVSGTGALGTTKARVAVTRGVAGVSATGALGSVGAHGAAAAGASARTGTGSIGTCAAHGAASAAAAAATHTGSVGGVAGHGGAHTAAPVVTGSFSVENATGRGAAQTSAPAVFGSGAISEVLVGVPGRANAAPAAGLGSIGPVRIEISIGAPAVSLSVAIGAVSAHGTAICAAGAVGATGTVAPVLARLAEWLHPALYTRIETPVLVFEEETVGLSVVSFVPIALGFEEEVPTLVADVDPQLIVWED